VVRPDGSAANKTPPAPAAFDQQLQTKTEARLEWKAAVYQAEWRKQCIKDLMRLHEQYQALDDPDLTPLLASVKTFLQKEGMLP